MRAKKNPNDFSFFEHLDELRGRLIKSLIASAVASCIVYSYIDRLLLLVVHPVGKLVFTSPPDAFTARIKLTLVIGGILAFPYIIFQAWQFTASALSATEKKYIVFFVPLACVAFLAGILFAYFVMLPISIRFLLSFSSEGMVPMITVNSYISFVGTLLLASGVVFELPLMMLFLTKMGIATPAFLIQKRRHAIVLILIVSAVLTPPDVFTQLIMAIPLIALYEIGIIVSRVACR